MKHAILLVICVIAGQCVAEKQFLDYRLSPKNDESTEESAPAKQCEVPGLMCSSCTSAVFCIQNGGELQGIVIEKCGTDTNCFQGQCVNKTSHTCTDVQTGAFKCNSIGMFPDPYDCSAFHVCPNTNIDSSMHLCPSKHNYDPISTYCKPAANGCPSTPPVPYCLKPGQTGALTNKSIFYICLIKNDKFTPVLYICEKGKTYINNKCA